MKHRKHKQKKQNKADVLVQFRLSDENLGKLELMAIADQRPVSNYVRVLIEKHVKNIQLPFVDSESPVPTLKSLAPESPTDDSADLVVPAQSFPCRLAPVSCPPDPAPCVYTDPCDVSKCEQEYAAWKKQNEIA